MTDKKLNFNLSTHCVGRITRSGIPSRVNITNRNNSWCWIINSSFTTIFVSCILLYIFIFLVTVLSKYFTLSFTVASFNVQLSKQQKRYAEWSHNGNVTFFTTFSTDVVTRKGYAKGLYIATLLRVHITVLGDEVEHWRNSLTIWLPNFHKSIGLLNRSFGLRFAEKANFCYRKIVFPKTRNKNVQYFGGCA